MSADTYLSTVTPAQVFARGSNLDTDSPSYYAAEVSRGYLTLSLVKVVNGTQTVLGTPVTSKTYVPYVWVQETLGISGSTLEAQVYRTDTQQYLNSSGTWQDTPTWAVTATDSSLSGPGEVGVARPLGSNPVETDYFDNFTTATGMAAQNFDTTTTPPAGSVPTGWQQQSSDGKINYFSVVNDQSSGPFLSAYNVLQSTGGASNVWSAAWDNNAADVFTNAQVSAGLDMATQMPPLQVVARGSDLGTATPSYYGLSTTAGEYGLTVNLVRVNNGTSTTLAQLAPVPTYNVNYFNGSWIQESLYVDGSSVRAQIYRPDTGEYLNSEDLWQTTPTFALNVTDTSPITTAGFAGLVRPSGASNINPYYFDNFSVSPLSTEKTPPSVTLSAPGGTLTGPVNVSATVTEAVPNDSISKVDFYVEDNATSATPTILTHWEETAAPPNGIYNWSWDTSYVPNGTHTLVVLAYDNAGNIGVAKTPVTVSNNTTLSMPSGYPPHPNSSVGIAELDYESDAADQTLVQNYVDTVIGEGQSDFGKIAGWDSSVQQLAYTNVSNIATSDLTAWLNYAETNGIDPEQAFYHASVPISWTGDSGETKGSTQPVDWFWGVYAYQNGSWQPDLTFAAHSGANNAIPFGDLATGSKIGDTLNVGYTDKFREIDINVSQAGSGGSYVLEYPTAVDSSGNPTSWATLTPISDSTNGLTANGKVIFDPPSNWVPAVVDSSVSTTRYYYVRFRTTAAFSAIPTASSILGYNYTNYQTDGQGNVTSYTIPAFDYAADTNHDGYLDAQEYANRAPGMNAYFAYQGRMFFDGQMRVFTNPSSPAFRTWVLQSYPPKLSGAGYNGFFVDNSQNNPPGQPDNDNVVEPTDSYTLDYASLLNALGVEIAPSNQWIMANINGANWTTGTGEDGQTNADPVVQKVQATYEEKNLRALTSNYTQFTLFYNRIHYRDTHDTPEYSVLDAVSSDGSAASEQDPQQQLTTLAAYYILAPNNPSQGALDFYGGENPSTAWVPSWTQSQFNHWSPAAGYNVGMPQSALPPTPDDQYTPTPPNNEESDGSTYFVYDRLFTGSNGEPALVLYKPISMLNGQNSKLTGSASATTVTLNGSYYVLQPNGTLSSTAVTSISLENGEGAILVQAGGNAPAIVRSAAMASTPSTSGPSVSQDSASPSNGDLLTANSFERLLPGLFVPNAGGAGQAPMGLVAEQGDASANLDQFLSQWAVEKLTTSLAGGKGPATNWPITAGKLPLPASIPSASLWLGPLRPSITSSFDESTLPANDAIAGSRVDDPLASSSAV